MTLAMPEAALESLGIARFRAERQLLCHCAADAKSMVPVAEREGLDHDHFAVEEHRMIFLGLRLMRSRGRGQQMRVLAAAIAQHGFDCEPSAGQRVARLFNAMFPSPASTRYWTRRVLDLDARETECGFLIAKIYDVAGGPAVTARTPTAGAFNAVSWSIDDGAFEEVEMHDVA